jgi:hypothetical protein
VKTQSMFPLCKLIEVLRVCLARDQSNSWLCVCLLSGP